MNLWTMGVGLKSSADVLNYKYNLILLQVITMLMGEYNYYQNFLHSGAVAKVLFVLFLLDMSVVLMNLVLGLAVSDIEQLQKNSGKFLIKVRRI